MSDSRILSVIFHGDAKSLVGASKEASDAAGGFGDKFASVAKVAAGAVVAVGVAAVGFAAKSAATFAQVGGEVVKLQRYTGLSAEAASRLRFAAQESGVGIDALTKSLGILSKNSVGSSLDKYKLGLKDATGAALPLNDQLLKLATKFQSMPAGAEKNALALKVFGKAGIDMLPFLNKGAAGIAELEKQSDKLGNTLNQKGLDAVKASTAAHREFSAVMEGLQLQVGQYVLPVITKFVTILSELLMPAIKVVGGIAQDYLAPAFSWAFGIMQKVAEDFGSFVTGTLLPAVGPVFRGIADIARDYLAPFVSAAFGVIETVMGAVADFATGTLWPVLVAALRAVADFARDYLAPVLVAAFGIVRQVIAEVVAFVRDTLVPDFKTALDRVESFLAPFATRAEAAFEKVRKAIDEKLSPAMRDRLQPIIDKLNIATGNHLPAALALGGAGTAALATQLGSLVGGLSGVVTAIAVIPNPVLLVIGALAALSAGVAYLYTHNRKFKETVDEVASALKDGLAVAIDVVKDAWPHIVNGATAVADFFNEHLLPTLQTFGTYLADKVWPIISKFVASLVQTFGGAVQWVQDNWPAISEAVTHVMNVVRDVITIVTNVVAALWRAWGDDLLHIVQAVFGSIAESIHNAFTIIEGIFTVILAIINGDWSAAWDGMKQIFGGVWAEICNQAGAAVNLLKSVIGGVLSTIAQVWNGVWSGISDKVGTIFGTVKTTVSNGVGAVAGFFTDLPGKIKDAFLGLADLISKPFTVAFGVIKKLWNDTVGGFGFSIPDWVPFVGGKSFHIPKMHTGGIFGAAGGEGFALLRNGEGVFTPEQMQALGLGLRSAWDVTRNLVAAATQPAPAASGGVNVTIQGGVFFGTNQDQMQRDLVAFLNQARDRGLLLT